MSWLRRAWYLVTRPRREDELAEELAFHRRMKAEELRQSGLDDAEVRSRVQRELGNDLLARERSRDVWIAPWLQDITQDLRFGMRMFLNEPRFTITAVVTIGLGFAVVGAVFTFVNAAMFVDLPFEAPDRLVTIRTQSPGGFSNAGVSYPEFLELQRQSTVFQQLTAESGQSVNLSDADHAAERLSGSFITPGTFRMLPVAPILGRDFTDEDHRDGAAPVVILSHGTWVSRYGGDAAIIGRDVRIAGEPATVIGVMPPGFTYPLVADLWLPMAMAPGIRNAVWTSTGFIVVGRLRDGVSLEQARAEARTIGANVVRDHPEMNPDRQVLVMGVKDSTLANGARQLLWALLAGSIVVLLVAGANVANLQLARAWSRSREIAVRVAIGAPRWRIVRQLLIECVLIGAGGTVLGVYLSFAGFAAMSSAFNVLEFGAPDRPRKPYWFDPTVDAGSWLILAVIFLLASLGTALIPALHLGRTDSGEALKEGREGQGGRSSRRWASLLTAGQIAMAVMLLTAGGLFARSFFALYYTDPVVAVEGLVGMRLTLSQKYATVEDRRQFVRRLDERLINSEFSESTIGSDMPLNTFTALSRSVVMEGEVPDPKRPPRPAVYIATGPRYFETFKFPIRRGRALSPEDELPGREGAVVNERFATMFFGNKGVIGKRIRLSQPGPPPIPPPAWLTIVGVVATVPDYLPNRPDDAVVYAPLFADPTPPRGLRVIVRGPSKAAATAALRREVAQLDGDLPVYAIQTMEEVLAVNRSGARMVGSWFQTLALIAVVLACVGLYALSAHGVAQRTREIGVRMALGAKAAQVMWLFVRQTLTLLAVGIVAGLAGALATTRLLVTFLGDIDPRDPLTLIGVAALLAAIAVTVGLGPARRAAQIDPVIALKSD
ncbi:MAG TPA: ABC transporter permease [Vicinamibacterales bacterium]|nr:ABC transporter permease [Vicinamibacterales bacterium]